MKKSKLLSLLILGVTLLSAGLGALFANPNKVEVSAASITVDSYYMYNANKDLINPIEEGAELPGSSIPGKTSGYSKTITVGTQDARITAVANNGYVLVGWLIISDDGTTKTYYELRNEEVSILADGTTKLTSELDGTETVVYKLSPYAAGYQGKKASFIVSEADKSLTVEPVFDYEKYTVSLKYRNGEEFYSGEYVTGEKVEINNMALNNFVIASSFSGATLTKVTGELTENTYKFVNDDDGRTTNFSLNYTVSGFKDVTLELVHTQLYRLDFKFLFDDVELSSGEKYENLLTCFTNNSNYRKVLSDSENSYYVVKNEGARFYLSDFGKYYQFVGYNWNGTEYKSKDIICDTLIVSTTSKNSAITVELNFTDKKYQINFGTALKRGSQISAIELNLPTFTQTEFVRGSEITLADVEALIEDVNNYGYQFVGWATKDRFGTFTNYTNSTIGIDVDNPSNISVFAVFVEVEYTIQFAEMKNYNLSNNGNLIYPIYELVANGSKVALTDNNGYLDVTSLNSTFTIGENVTITKPSINKGFEFLGFGLTPQTVGPEATYKYNSKNHEVLTITSKIIEDYANGTKISLYPYFEYVNYNINYSVNNIAYATIAIDITGTDATSSTVDNVINITGLKLYDKVVFNSVAQDYENGEKYQCYLFNVGGTTYKSTDGSLTHTVSDSVDIQVVYGVPQTNLVIDIVGLPTVPDFVVYQYSVSTDPIQKAGDGDYYTVQSGNVNVKVVWNEVSYYGYEWELATLEYNGNTTDIEKSVDGYDFTVEIGTAKTTYTLTIQFKPVVYTYEFTTEFNESTITKTGTFSAENPIKFEKEVGYFVVNVKSATRNGVNQTNDSKAVVNYEGEDISLFTYYFVQFAQIKDVLMADVDASKKISFTFDYEIYKYQVKVNFLQFKNGSTSGVTGASFPDLNLQSDAFIGVPTRVVGESAVVFNNVPYGFSGELTAGNVLEGFTKVGFCDEIGENASDKYDFSTNNVIDSVNLYYRVDFNAYLLKFVSETDGVELIEEYAPAFMYEPVTGVELSIGVETGYKFNYIYYEYRYDPTSWGTVELYVKNDKILELNTDDEYVTSKTYYIKINTSEFTLEQFDVINYVPDNATNEILFAVNYAPIEMEVVNFSVLDTSKDSIKNNMMNLFSISTDGEFNEFINNNIATFVVKAKNKAGVERTVQVGEFVTVEDTLIITISINNNFVHNGYSYDFTKGIKLYTGNYANIIREDRIINITKSGNDSIVEFSVMDCKNLNIFAENGEVVLTHMFGENDSVKEIELTTNLESLSEFNKNIVLTLVHNQGERFNENGVSNVEFTGSFLLKTKTMLKLNKKLNGRDEVGSVYNEYFNMSLANVSVYINGEEITLSDYTVGDDTYYGNLEHCVVVRIDENGYVVVETVMIPDDIKIVYNVQPILHFEGTKFEAGVSNAYTFGMKKGYEHYYSYDAGVKRPLTLANGQGKSGADIEGFDVVNHYVIEYYKSNGEKFEPSNSNCIPAGTYTIKLIKRTDGGVNPYPEITADLKLVVQKMKIKLSGKLVGTIINQEYNYTTYTYTDFAIKSQGSGILITATDVDNKEFKIDDNTFTSDYVPYISKTITEIKEGVDYDWLNESLAQVKWKDVDTGTLNLYVKGFKFKSSTDPKKVDLQANYELVEDFVFIERCINITTKELKITGYLVHDKVYNGDDNYETTITDVNNTIKIQLIDLPVSEDVKLNVEKIKAYFHSTGVGTGKTIYVNAYDALEGKDKTNYHIGSSSYDKRFGQYSFIVQGQTGTVYPNQITSTDGSIQLRNIRGLTDINMLKLLPLNAVLTVNKIEKETEKYVEIYPNISDFISRRNVFQVGYELILKDKSGKQIPIDSNLHLVLLKAEGMSDVLSITDKGTFNVTYTKDGDGLIIDLSQLETKVITHLVLTESSQLLKPWQIALIVSVAVVVIGGGITAAIIIRKKKKGSYGRYDKI